MADPDLELRGAQCFTYPVGFIPSIILFLPKIRGGGGGRPTLDPPLEKVKHPANFNQLNHKMSFLRLGVGSIEPERLEIMCVTSVFPVSAVCQL